MKLSSAHCERVPVELIFLDMSGRSASFSRDLRLLNPEERARAARFQSERDQTMFVACRAALRRILAERTHVPAEAIQFVTGACGKPALSPGQSEAEINFNISHSGDWFACALAEHGPVGVDIEQIHTFDDMAAVAGQFFASAEMRRLFALPEQQRLLSFFECWTRKESVIKATGEGVSRPLSSFEVAFGPGVLPALLRLDDCADPPWGMRSFRPADGYVAAVSAPFGFEVDVQEPRSN